MRSTSRNDLSSGSAAGRTVLTLFEGRQVFLLALGNQRGTMGRTHVARPLAIAARLGTRFVRCVMFVVGCEGGSEGEYGHGETEEG